MHRLAGPSALLLLPLALLLSAGSTARASDAEKAWHPPLLTALRQPAPAPGPAFDLAVDATGPGGAHVVRLAASVEGETLVVVARWTDADEDRVAEQAPEAQADALRLTFAAGVGATYEPEARTEAPRCFVARAGASAGAWKDGQWTARIERALAGERELGLQVTVDEGGLGRSVSPWIRVLLGGERATKDFEQDAPGAAAQGLRSELGGAGAPPSWVVREKDGSRVLVQEAQDDTPSRFPLALVEGFSARDVDLSVRFRTLEGFADRAAGLVWRVKDAHNHYILRANTLEGNVVLYKLQDNLRVDLAPLGREGEYGAKVRIEDGWHVLRVVARGARFQAYLDGRRLFEVQDATFAGPGGVGLWTKADSVTAFDDLQAIDLQAVDPGRPPAGPPATDVR